MLNTLVLGSYRIVLASVWYAKSAAARTAESFVIPMRASMICNRMLVLKRPLLSAVTIRCSIPIAMSPYPTKSEIEQLASYLGTKDASLFLDRVSPNVIWDVLGVYTVTTKQLMLTSSTGTCPASGHFTSLGRT